MVDDECIRPDRFCMVVEPVVHFDKGPGGYVSYFLNVGPVGILTRGFLTET